MDETWKDEATASEPLFVIYDPAHYTDKHLQHEFGRLVLRRRPVWYKVCEGMSVACIVMCSLFFWQMAHDVKDGFLGLFMHGLTLGFAIACVVIAVWGAVYLWLLRPRTVGRKRLSRINGRESTMYFYDDHFTMESRDEHVDLTWEQFPWGRVHVGEYALYLEIKTHAMFTVFPYDAFLRGDDEAFVAFLREKAGVSVRDIT